MPEKTQTGLPTARPPRARVGETSLPSTTSSEESSASACALRKRGGTRGEPLPEEEVEGRDADDERQRDGADRREQEPRANAETQRPSHRSE